MERRWIAGSCPTIACMPSKNEVWSARVAHLAHHGAQFGVTTGSVTTDMATVLRTQARLWSVARSICICRTSRATGTELIVGDWALCGAEDAGGAPE